jgi:spore germination protein YaaH
VEAVVQYTAREVGPEKLLLGVAFYGYDWPRRGSAEGVSMREAVSRAAHARTPILWDSEGQVPYYKTDGRTVYFENASSIERKLTLATRRQLAGVAAWRLGYELPEVWDVLATYQNNPTELTARTLTRRSSGPGLASLLAELIRPLGQK